MKKEDILPDKDDFITFLSQATPEELNRLIAEKGKPPRLVDPIFFFDKYKKSNDKQ